MKVNKKGSYECDFHFQPPVRSGNKVENRNARSIAEPTDPSEDCECNDPTQPGYRLFRRWNADDSEPASIRPEWSLGRQFRCDGRRYWRDFSAPCFTSRPSLLLQILRQK